MAKKQHIIILFMSVWLASCTPVTPIPTPTATMATFTPSATPTLSHTPTPSIPPLPTIPTATPTFDISSIVTVTPAPAEQCPETTPIINPDLSFLTFHPKNPNNQEERDTVEKNRREAKENILEFINSHGPIPLVEYFEQKGYVNGEDYIYQDLTNDRIPELAIGVMFFNIFGCKNGRYETLLELPPDMYLWSPNIVSFNDYNKDGIDEIVFRMFTMSQGGRVYQIYEWNNVEFTNLIPEHLSYGQIYIQATGELHFEDIDNDGIDELVVNSGIPIWSIYYDGLPWRNEKTYYKWNGEFYVPIWREFSIPDVDFVTIQEFRFQSIQDGDLAISQGEYDKALDFYQHTIDDSSLSGYSLDIRKNLQENWIAHISNNPTPTPCPDDPSEYPKLASYAYYRIMLLHVVQGNLAEAEKTYNTLQEEFAHDQYGAPYAEMARDFWQAYQQNQNMTDACGAAITYAAIHPEILIPLDSNYHGWQSHTYQSTDICPFR